MRRRKAPLPCRVASEATPRRYRGPMPHLTVADGVRIHYRTFGRREGEPLLLLHGLGTDHMGWMMQRHSFGSRYRCIVVDNRGSGRSDKPDGDYDLQVMAHDAVAVLDELGIDRAHVVGASMGGVLTQIIGVTHGDRVRSLVLACTACRLQPWRRELFDDWIEQAERVGMRRFIADNLEWLIGPRSMRRLWPVARVIGVLATRAPVHGLTGQLRALLSVDESLTGALASIAAPTLVVVGSQDILTPVADSEQLVSLIPGAELAVITGAAHGLMVDHALTFNRTVLDFLASPRALVD